VLTTFTSYGAVARDRQADILNGLINMGGAKARPMASQNKETVQQASPICRKRHSDMMALD